MPQTQTTSLLTLTPGRRPRVFVLIVLFAWSPYAIVMPPVATVTDVTYLPVIVFAALRPAWTFATGHAPVFANVSATAALAAAARFKPSVT